LELDSEIPESHISIAISDMFFFRNLPEAETSLQKALALEPNSAYAHGVSCWLANEMGNSTQAIAECRKAVELDPLSIRANFDLALRVVRSPLFRVLKTCGLHGGHRTDAILPHKQPTQLSSFSMMPRRRNGTTLPS